MNLKTKVSVVAFLLMPLLSRADPPARPPASVSAPLIVKVLVHGRSAVVIRNYQLDFYEVPEGVAIDEIASERKKDLHFTKGSRALIAPLKPLKSHSYKHLIEISPALPEKLSSVIIACTNLVYEPILPSGKIDQFCGILSLRGDVVFEFPFRQELPDKLMSPLWYPEDNGTWAGVFIGRMIDEEDGPSIGRPREVWVWRAPKTLEKYSARSENPTVKKLLQFSPQNVLEGPKK